MNLLYRLCSYSSPCPPLTVLFFPLPVQSGHWINCFCFQIHHQKLYPLYLNLTIYPSFFANHLFLIYILLYHALRWISLRHPYIFLSDHVWYLIYLQETFCKSVSSLHQALLYRWLANHKLFFPFPNKPCIAKLLWRRFCTYIFYGDKKFHDPYI